MDELEKRLRREEAFTFVELEMLFELVEKFLPKYELVRKVEKAARKSSEKMPLGEGSAEPVNPVTGVFYTDKLRDDLVDTMLANGLCGQFAGRRQWQQVGRSVTPEEKPVKVIKLYGNQYGLFSYEQTRTS
jgi:hypothetical protein